MENLNYDFIPSLRVGDFLPSLDLDVFHKGSITKISSDDYEGKWKVFVFYPADFTFVCPTELGELADLHAEFKGENAEVFSVSTDTAFVHKAWKDASPTIAKIEYPMIADPSGALCKLFGTYLHDEGLSLRGSFIVNPEGELIAMEINNNDIGRCARELLRKLRAAKYVNENVGHVCPASWNPGDKDLKPGIDLVGKI